MSNTSMTKNIWGYSGKTSIVITGDLRNTGARDVIAPNPIVTLYDRSNTVVGCFQGFTTQYVIRLKKNQTAPFEFTNIKPFFNLVDHYKVQGSGLYAEILNIIP